MIDLKDLGLTPEVEAEINKRVTSSEEGLVANRDKILAQNVKLKDILGAADDEDLAKKLADDIQLRDDRINELSKEVLGLKGDKEGLEKLNQSISTQEQEKQQQLKERLEARIKSSSESALMEKVLAKFHDKGAKFVKSTLSSMLSTTIDEEGNATTTINDGSNVYQTADEFLSFADSDNEWSGMMRAPDTKGVGALGGDGRGLSKKPSEMSSAERIEFKQKDPEGFRQAFNL